MDNWIEVKRPPSHGGDVLVTNGADVWIGDYDYRRREIDGGKWAVVWNGAPPFDSTDITHWQELPNPPQKTNS